MKIAAPICALALASSLGAQTYVVPVATAKIKDRVYTTTLALRNDGQQDVSCEAIYAVPNDSKNGTLRATYTVPRGGRPQVEEDLLMAVGAVGTMRLACSEKVVIAARIQTSTDGGKTFDEGRTFAALDEAASFRRLRTVTARTDLLVAEVAGKPVTLEAIVKNDAGAVIGRKTYQIPAFAQQIVNLSKMREDATAPHVDLRIVNGTGAIVVGEETRDPALLKIAVRMSSESRRAFEQHQAQQLAAATAAANSVPSITEQLLISPFKAAPFREPATGLVFMRDRWYDPSTGTFLTQDPEGYGNSSNPYIFCGGDPVNCSDPTGRAAAVGTKGWIVGKRPDGSHYRFSPEYARQHPLEVQVAFESDADLTRADVERLMAQARLPMGQTVIPCRPGETCMRRGVPNTRYGKADYAIGPAVSASNTLIGFSNQVNRVHGQPEVPYIPYASQRQQWAGDRFDEAQLAFAVATLAAGGANGLARQPALTARVFRVEGTPNTRIFISESGNVTVLGDDMLFLNFGSRARAEAFFARRLEQGMPSVMIKEFDVPYSFLDDLRAAAVPERLARQFPDRPILVDPTKAPDQFGLRPEQIRALQGAVVQGTGTTGRP
ncbi:MAG: RHS repeat-associated core domain-containing protein [Thermoanaerobaculia bacterium]